MANQPLIEDEIWTTEDGRRIPVGELEVDHMRNILRMILRNHHRKLRRNAAVREVFEELEDFDHNDRIWGNS